MEFALRLLPGGEIHFIQGEGFTGHLIDWSCGISRGDGRNYHIPEMAGRQNIFQEDAVRITPMPLPEGMELTESGLFHGIPQNYYQHYPLRVSVEDDEHVFTAKELLFSSGELGEEEIPQAMAEMVKTYPNPFRDELEIVFNEKLMGPLTCIVYDISGKEIAVLAENMDCRYPIQLTWDNNAAAGVYFIRWKSGSYCNSEKVICTGH